MLKLISCVGFGNTGSSIVTDFFQEFSSIKVIGGSLFEFLFLHEADGIRDLQNAVVEGHRLKVDLAIKRFIKLIEDLNNRNPSGPNYKGYFNGKFLEYSYQYLMDLGVVEWKYGWWYRISECDSKAPIKDLILLNRYQKNVRKVQYSLYEADSWKPSFLPYHEQYYCHKEKEKFVEITKKYLEKLFREMVDDNEYLLFDQLLPTNCDQDYFDYFDFAKLIIVDRDPRDLYFANKVFWGSGYIPSENPNIFIDWYKSSRKNVSQNENIISIKFEEMVYCPEKTQKKLCDFVNLDINLHDKPRTHLFVEQSMTNTLFYKKYDVSSVEPEMSADLIKIEKELADYLFDFDAYSAEQIIPKKMDDCCEKNVSDFYNKYGSVTDWQYKCFKIIQIFKSIFMRFRR